MNDFKTITLLEGYNGLLKHFGYKVNKHGTILNKTQVYCVMFEYFLSCSYIDVNLKTKSQQCHIQKI